MFFISHSSVRQIRHVPRRMFYRSVFGILYATSLSFISCEKKAPEPTITYPPEQVQFHAMNSTYPNAYKQAPNEIKKSAVFNACNQWRTQFVKEHGGTAQNWIGKVKSIRTDQGGDHAYIVIVSTAGDFAVSFETGDELLPSFDTFMQFGKTTSLEKGTKVYDEVGSLKEGQYVRFTAKFAKDKERGVKEASVTEEGCVDEPEFVMCFDDISPYP